MLEIVSNVISRYLIVILTLKLHRMNKQKENKHILTSHYISAIHYPYISNK